MSIQNYSSYKQSQTTIDFKIKYKTEKCRFWFEKGFCPFNRFCAFAHTSQEIREKKELNVKYKTKACLNFFNNGYCKYGDRCQYLHSSFSVISDGQKTRSSSEESYSSKSSNQDKIKNKNLNRGQFKHQNRLQILNQNDIQILDIIMSQKSRLGRVMNQQAENELCNPLSIYQMEYYCSLGNSEWKKQRMYSM